MDPRGLARSLSLTGCSLRHGHDRYLTEPPRSIQLGPHFSTLGCHHASPYGRYILDICARFSYGFGRPCVTYVTIDDFMTFVLRTYRAPDAHTGAYFMFRVRFTDLHGGYMCDDRWFHDICSSDLPCTRCPYWGIFSISDVIYGSSLMLHVRR